MYQKEGYSLRFLFLNVYEETKLYFNCSTKDSKVGWQLIISFHQISEVIQDKSSTEVKYQNPVSDSIGHRI